MTTVMDPRDALRTYCDWLLSQRTDDDFFCCLEDGEQKVEWYMIFYPLRALLLGGDVLEDTKYIEATFPIFDNYISEQLPNGGFTSDFRRTPTERLSKAAFQDILRTGKVNLADNGTNINALIQAAGYADKKRRDRYLQAARCWLDNWVPIWALPDGGYGNGIWVGHKINAPYTMAIANVASAFSAFYKATGEDEYREHAERGIDFQCMQWLEDGRPVNLSVYPLPHKQVIMDYGRIFYLLEGMCWTHSVSRDEAVKTKIADRMRQWIFAEQGVMSQWRGNWFNFNPGADVAREGELKSSRLGIRIYWELAKANAIPYALLYYLRQIEDDKRLSEPVERGMEFLRDPNRAVHTGIMADPAEGYGQFSVQATGFGCISLAEMIQPGVAFAVRE